MDRPTQQQDIWVRDRLNSGGTGGEDASLLANRRRPGRAKHVSPELVSLLRERDLSLKQYAAPVSFEAEAVERLNWFHFLLSFCITLTISASVWAIIFAGSWLLL